MKRLKRKMLIAAGVLSVAMPAMAQEVTVQAGEYWIDEQFDSRKTVDMTGVWRSELDVSKLCEGVHVLGFRAVDSEGRWSVPLARYFLRVGQPFTDNTLSEYEIWIDDEEAARDKGQISGGVASLNLDLASLSAGLHRLALRVSDSRGVWSSPRTNFFVVPDTLPAGNGISAYSYWFNRGPRIRVDVNTSNPLIVSDLWIEVKDVVPNRIPSDYRFDTATETLYCDDDVFFGIQAYDMAGSPTEAVLSDTFRMTVPVIPDFVDLADGLPVAFAAPEAGYVSGFRMRAAAGDSLVWTVGAGCNTDMYAADGSRIAWKADEESDGKITFGMRAASDVTYALVHSASVALKMMDISCTVASSTAISGCVSAGCSLHVGRGMLAVDASESGMLSVTSLSGVAVFHGNLSAGHNVITLPSGVYVIAWNGVSVGKTVVP